MIVTQLMWSSLDSYSKYYAHFWPHPFEWDHSRQEYIAHAKSTKFLPYFVSIVALGFAPLACITLLTVQSLCLVSLDLLEVLVTILILLVVTLVSVAEWSFSSHRDEFKFYINYLKRVDAHIQSRKFKWAQAYLFYYFNIFGWVTEFFKFVTISKSVTIFAMSQVYTLYLIKPSLGVDSVYSDGLYFSLTHLVVG